MLEIVISMIGVLGSIFTIVFAYLAFRRNERRDQKYKGKEAGILLSDIGYIKSSIDRMEGKLDKVEDNYQKLVSRIVKLEELYSFVSDRIKEIKSSEKV